MANSALLAVANSAERQRAVGIGLAAGGMTVYGVPVARSEYFDKITHSAAGAALASAKPKKVDKDRVWAEIYHNYKAYFDEVRTATSDEPENLFFIAPLVVHVTGSTGSPPGLCVPFENIDAWWYGDPRWKAPSSGGGWFVGAAVPIDV